MIGSQLLLSLCIAPRGMPKCLMGSWAVLHPRTPASESDELLSSMISSDFFKLIFNPDAAWKHRTMHLRWRRLLMLSWQKKRISSAKNRWENFIGWPFIPTGIPSNRPNDRAYETSLLRASIIMMSNKGERGSHCLKPLEALKNLGGPPFIITAKLVEEMHSLIQLLHLQPKPRFTSMWSIHDQRPSPCPVCIKHCFFCSL